MSEIDAYPLVQSGPDDAKVVTATQVNVGVSQDKVALDTYIRGGTITTQSSPFSPPAECDYIGRSVASNVETFTYKDGGSSGTLLKTITVTYTDSTLEELVSIEVA